MTPTEIRIAMAELEGWRIENYGPVGHRNIYWRLLRPDGAILADDCVGEDWSRAMFSHMVPDYPSDLNAVRRVAFKALNFDEQASTDLFRFRCALTKISGNDRDLCVFASAIQVSEAILRAVGKWKENAV